MSEQSPNGFGRAIVLESSLASELPQEWDRRLLSRRVHRLGSLSDAVVLEYSVKAATEQQAAFELAARLRAPGFYAHIVRDDSLIVIFPSAIFLLKEYDADTIKRCREFGLTLGIPGDQMQFELMFTVDHPDQVETRS
jgi:hypothetical protein